MAKTTDLPKLLPSLLDRLIDEDPANQRKAPQPPQQILRGIRRSLSRDVESLLNTRIRALPWPADLTELEQSLVNYGLPDFLGPRSPEKLDWETLSQRIQEAIERFEPRLQDVHVAPIESEGDGATTIRFRIEGVLYAEPAPERITFDSQMDAASSVFGLESSP